MCLIAIAGEGTDKYSEEFIKSLINASETNKDGIGYTFKRHKNKKVYISKGYADIEKVIKSLKSKKLSFDDELIVHLRIGNRGSINKDMCHPFVLSDDKNIILSNNKFVDYPTMVHNGTFHSYVNSDDYSDTYKFVKTFMSNPLIIELLKDDIFFFKEIFSYKLTTNRLAFLFPDCDQSLIKIGDFKYEKGYYYSNDSYKSKTYNIGGREYASLEDYYSSIYGKNRNINRLREKLVDNDEQLLGEVTYTKPKTIELTELIENPNRTKLPNNRISLGFRIGFRKANEQEIPFTKEVFKDAKYAISFSNSLDILIPEEFKTDEQFDSIQILPNKFNYTDLYLLAIKDDNQYNIERGATYTINHLGDKHYVLTKIQNNNFIGKVNFISIPKLYLHLLFESKILPKNIIKYKDYYELVKRLQPSQTTLKHLASFLRYNSNVKDKVLMYKNVGPICKYALDLFKYTCASYVNSQDEDDRAINHKYMF